MIRKGTNIDNTTNKNKIKVIYSVDIDKSEEIYVIKGKFLFGYKTMAILKHAFNDRVVVDIDTKIKLFKLYGVFKKRGKELTPGEWVVYNNFYHGDVFRIKFTKLTKFYYWLYNNSFKMKIYNPIKNYLADLNLKLKMKFNRNTTMNSICDSYYNK